MSVRPSFALPSNCSGGMKKGVPMTIDFACSSASNTLARPKSAIFTPLPGVTMMFPGLMSRWMMFFEWACARPRQHWEMMSTDSSTDIHPFSWRMSWTVVPSTYSMAR